MNVNMTIMSTKGSYQQQYITTMRRRKQTMTTTTKTSMTRMTMAVPGTYFLIAQIMIWMSLPKKETKHPLGMKLVGR